MIGIDFGTDSARAILVDASDGKEVASHVSMLKRWWKGLYCDSYSDRYRQHPQDYLDSLEEVLKGVLEMCPENKWVKAISIDSTGRSPCLTDADLTPQNQSDHIYAIRPTLSETSNQPIVSPEIYNQGQASRYLHNGLDLY